MKNSLTFIDNNADEGGEAGKAGEEAAREAELRRLTAEEVAAAIRSGEMVTVIIAQVCMMIISHC